jgi:hypothetical protein
MPFTLAVSGLLFAAGKFSISKKIKEVIGAKTIPLYDIGIKI